MTKNAAPPTVLERLYPETVAGGFSQVDGTVSFYQRVNALLRPSMTVVDFGAGRGQASEDPVEYRRGLATLKGKVERVVGLDVDDAVLENPSVDEAQVIIQGSPLPLPDESVDLLVSDFTFEHVTDPGWATGELTRILKPGGWICARTPNKWGGIGVPARMVPNRFHDAVLKRAQPLRRSEDTFPTAYRLNTFAELAGYFPPETFRHASYTMNNEPDYYGNSALLWRIVRASFRATPDRLGSMLYVFLQKLPRHHTTEEHRSRT